MAENHQQGRKSNLTCVLVISWRGRKFTWRIILIKAYVIFVAVKKGECQIRYNIRYNRTRE